MHYLMFLKIALSTEGLTTHVTAIWALPTMSAEMYLRLHFANVCPVTHIAGIWMLATMYALTCF
jgi:hypothetical protein